MPSWLDEEGEAEDVKMRISILDDVMRNESTTASILCQTPASATAIISLELSCVFNKHGLLSKPVINRPGSPNREIFPHTTSFASHSYLLIGTFGVVVLRTDCYFCCKKAYKTFETFWPELEQLPAALLEIYKSFLFCYSMA